MDKMTRKYETSPSTLWMLGNFARFFCRLLIFFKINFSKKFFQKYHQSIKQFGSRSGLTYCQAWSGSKLFAKIISRRHKQVMSWRSKTSKIDSQRTKMNQNGWRTDKLQKSTEVKYVVHTIDSVSMETCKHMADTWAANSVCQSIH